VADLSADVTQAFAHLYLLPTAPAAIVQAVYRTLARQHHPDLAGGDHRATIVRVEHGQAAIVSTARRLADVLQLTHDQLVNEDPEQAKQEGAA
jgi:hypothetical protein